MVQLDSKIHAMFYGVFLLFCMGVPAQAQKTIHVPADVPTIQAGIDAAQNGDTVLVAPGTYDENLNFKGKVITVTSGAKTYSDAAAAIVSGASDGPVVTFAAGESAAAVLNGFTIQNGHASLASNLNAGGISIAGASPTITNNIVANNFGCGILVYNSAGPLIQGNDIRQNSAPPISFAGCSSTPGSVGVAASPGTGIGILSAGSVQIVGNIIEDNVAAPDSSGNPSCGAGIDVFSGSELLVKNNIIRNNKASCNAGFMETIGDPVGKLSLIQNLIYGNTNIDPTDSIQVFVTGVVSAPLPSVTEINNTIYGLGQEVVLSFSSAIIENNIFVNTLADSGLQWALWCADSESANSPGAIAYNDIVSAQALSSGCNLGPGNLSAQPLFRDAANGDFHEQAGSPTIDAGSLSAPSLPAADLDGKSRIFCGAVDMGAYEWHPTPPIALSSSNNPVQGGSPITFSAQLTGSCNIEPTGVVTFADAGSPIGSSALNSQALATFTTAFLVVGQHNITAEYPGDFNFNSNTSAVLVQTVIGDPTSSMLMVAPNPATAFQPVTFSSTVTSPYVTPNGTVIFTANGQNVASGTLNSTDTTSATISSLGAGTYSVVANYQATTLFHSSSSAPVQLTVLGVASTTTMTASPNPVTVTQAAAFTVKVAAAQGNHLPTGTVTLLDGGTVLKTATLDANGSAVIPISTLSVGTHTITARYGGDANFNASSATVSEIVALIGAAMNLTASPNPANNGQTVTMTATVTPSLNGAALVGTVTFYDGATALGAVPLNGSGTATFSTSALTVGTHPLTASMLPTPTLAGSISAVVDEVVQRYDFALSLSKNALTLPAGGWTLLTVTVSPVGGFSGDVSLSCTGSPAHVQCLFPSGSSTTIGGSAKTLQLAINTSDVYGWGSQISRTESPGVAPSRSMGFLALCCALPIFSFAGLRRSSSVWRTTVLRLLIPALLLIALMAIGACGGKNPAVATPGTYTLTVSGVSSASGSGAGAYRHSTSLELSITK